MNVGILYFAGDGYGLGHHYRCLELAKELRLREHDVYMFSNLQFKRKLYFQVRPEVSHDLYHALDQCSLDWLIVDIPEFPYDYIIDYKDKFGYNILNLNADKDSDVVDISIIQGCLPGTFSGPEWVILRSILNDVDVRTDEIDWFVFGGSEDKMGIIEMFTKSMDKIEETAFLVAIDTSNFSTDDITNFAHMPTIPNDDMAFLNVMTKSKKACISFGVTAWELAFFGIPTYAFSSTNDHLRWAQAMEKEGLLKAYPCVGVPNENAVVEFLHEPFEVDRDSFSKLDTYAVNRISDLMEKE